MSFGKYLQAAREAKGIRLEDVSDETKISIYKLIQLENEDFKRLPEEVYVRGFIRAYAKAIGIDAGEPIRLYASAIRKDEKPLDPQPDQGKDRKRFWFRLGVALAGLFIIVVISVLLISSPKTGKPLPSGHHPEEMTRPEPGPVPDTATQSPGATPSAELSSTPGIEGLKLNIRAIQNTWLRVASDDQEQKSFNLKAGDRLTLTASSGFALHIGNAAGVEMELNGKPISMQGTSGQVIKMKIP
ncbi:MAG: RodZ domain-containing protein [Thermodesulfobacteriota bacterium]